MLQNESSNLFSEINTITFPIADEFNNSRTSCNDINSSTHSENLSNLYHKTILSDEDIDVTIFRYKFSDDFTNELFKFSKIHQYEHRKVFKESWENWLLENIEILNKEKNRLKILKYEGNIEEKMFKSARYYFRKKSVEKIKPIQRRNYISINKELLDIMDEHLENICRNNSKCKPSNSFEEFCKIHIDILKESVNLLVKNGFTNVDEIKNKIKKTYKNRYFLLIRK